jgi:hypothetical protein
MQRHCFIRTMLARRAGLVDQFEDNQPPTRGSEGLPRFRAAATIGRRFPAA